MFKTLAFKKLTTTAIAVAAITCASQAMAENYVGGNISALKGKADDFSDSANLVALYGRLGTEFTENFSAEIRVGIGLDDDNNSYSDGINNVNISTKLKHFYGAYVRGTIPIVDTFYPYAVVGYTQAEVETKIDYQIQNPNISGSAKGSDSDGDISFGVGADIRLTSNTDLNLEYMNYYDKDDVSIDGLSLGFTYRFY